jgi:hypothetical protein
MREGVGFREPVDRRAEHRPGIVWRLTVHIDHGASGRTAVPALRAADNALREEACMRRV